VGTPSVKTNSLPLLQRLMAGDTAALARAITLIEAGGALAGEIQRGVYPATGRALVVGFTGPPGAGKSTLIDAYVSELRGQGRTVAIAAVDPSSPLSGGAILGDRVRMGRHTEDAGVFIRSISSRGHLGGLSEGIHGIIDAMDAAGRDVVIVETVGTGQSEVEVVEIADVRVVVNAPGLGDDVQAIKAGVLEIADVLVVNKADLPLADRAVRQLRSMLQLRERHRQAVSVVETVATDGRGVKSLAEIIDGLGSTIGIDHRRTQRHVRIRRLIAQAVARLVRRALSDSNDAMLNGIVAEVASGKVDFETAAGRVLRTLAPLFETGQLERAAGKRNSHPRPGKS
jgi:LAO/AO transport system kinase